MSALQESRRELMVQLEGLMNLLKVSSYFILFSSLENVKLAFGNWMQVFSEFYSFWLNPGHEG